MLKNYYKLYNIHLNIKLSFYVQEFRYIVMRYYIELYVLVVYIILGHVNVNNLNIKRE